MCAAKSRSGNNSSAAKISAPTSILLFKFFWSQYEMPRSRSRKKCLSSWAMVKTFGSRPHFDTLVQIFLVAIRDAEISIAKEVLEFMGHGENFRVTSPLRYSCSNLTGRNTRCRDLDRERSA